jgi:hypothetical protein
MTQFTQQTAKNNFSFLNQNLVRTNFFGASSLFIKALMLAFFVLATTMSSLAQNTATIGSGTTATTSTGSDPIWGYWESFRYQVVYTASELNAAGMAPGASISALGFSILGDYGGGNLLGYTIKMGHTTATNSAAHDASTTSTVKNAFSYNPSVTAAGAFDMITLDASFVWNGTSNILIDICSSGPNPYASPYGAVRTIASFTTNGSRSIGNDGAGSLCGTTTSSTNSTKPQIRFTWGAAGPCSGTPNTPSISGATSACAGVNFNLSSAGASSGTGISYQWQSSTNGGASWSPISGATATSLTTNASTNTQYQLVTTCSASGLTSTSAAYSVTISSFSACTCFTYPAIYSSSTFDEEISNVTVGSMNNSSTCSVAATGPGSILNRYANYAGVVTGPSAMQTDVVNFSLTQTSCGGNYGSFFQIYLDWNQDGDWLDVGEQVYSQGATVNGNQTVTGSFTVPAGATVGVTRMRVVHIETFSASTTNYAHTAYSYGETEDYCFTVNQLVTCSGTPNAGVAGISIANGCSGASATLSASGLSSGTGISYQWASGPTATGPWTNGSTSASTTVNPTSDTYYQLTTTCGTSGLSSTSNVVSFSVNTCAASITMTDQFGDGWNGASMNVLVNGSVFQTITLASGSSQTLNFCFPTNSTYALVYTAGGFYPSEVGVNMTVNGTLVYNVGFGGASVGATLVSGVSCPPVPIISSIPSSGCPDVPISISGSNFIGTTAVQFGGVNAASFNVVNANTILATPTANATGTITVTSGSGTGSSSTIFTILPQSGIPTLTASQNQLCGTGGTITLSASGGSGTYLWSSSQGSPGLSSTSGSSITAAITQTSAIQLTATTVGGCNSGIATTTITVLANPTAPTITSSVNSVCLGGTSNLSVQLGASGITYCVPTYTTGSIFDDYIGRVQLGTINNVTLGSPAPFYTLYPSTGSTTTSLATGSTQTISLSSGTFPFNQNMAVWIDYNQNGVFSDPGEKLGEVLNVPQFPATSTITFTVPGAALVGATRMRVRDVYFSSNLDPCLNYSYGETEDYVVNITGTATYTYIWSPAVAGNSSAPTVSTLPITGSTTFTAVVNDGTCSSAPSNAITIGIAGTPVITTAASSPVSGYCPSAAQYTFDEEIFNVSLGTMNNTSDCITPAGGPGSILERYSNFTSGAGAPAVPNLAAGSTTAGSVTVGTCGSFNYTSGLAVFIDFNQDGDFTDVGEKVFTNGPVANVNCLPATAVPISVTVPATAVGGQTRMRVVNQESIAGDNITPCTIQSWGETEDYLVNITGGAVNIPCPGSTFNLSSTATNGGAPYTYAWTVLSGSATLSAANISNPTAVVNTDAVLQLTVTDVCGSTTTSTVATNIDENPIAIVPANSVICINDIATLTASNGNNYTWAPSNNLNTTNGAVVSATPSTTETYTVTASYGIGCTGTANTTITVNALPIVDAGPNQTLCAQNSATVSGSGASTYAWDNNISNGVAFTPTATATYTVVGTDANGCTNTDQVQVVVNALPNVIAGINQTLCAGTAVTLSGAGAVSYSWDNSINDGVAFTPTATNNYTVVGTDANGCTNTDTVQVVVNALPIVIAGINQTVCAGTAVTLVGTGAVTYSWDNSINDGVAFTPTNTATYTVTGTDANGCIDTDQLQVVVNALPIVIAGNSQTVCIGTAVTLSAAGAVTYTWDNSINDGVAFTPSNTATYTVTGTDINGCIDTDQVQVIVNPLPVTSAGNNQTVCSGTTVTLAGSGATSYSWNNNISNGVPFTATSTTTYTVTGTNGNGCVNTAQMTVIVNTLPVVTAGSNQSVCPGTAVTLNGSGALFYSWNNGISNGLPFTPSATTTYTVTGTASNGCSNTAQVQVILNALPTVSAGSNQTICPGASVTLSGSGAASYSWNNSVSNGVAFTPTATTTYTVTGTNANGCSNTAQTTVTINPILTVNAGADVMSCTGETVILSGQGANTYTWSNGVQNGQGFVPTATGVYSVSGVDSFGCTGTDQVTVYVNSASSSTVTALACNSYELNGQTYNQSGTYSQTIPNAFGCDSTITLNLTLDTPLSTPIVTVSSGELFTNGQANTSYQWIFCNSGFPISDETDTLYVPNLNGQFAVTASNSCGSSTSACVTINYMGVEEAKVPSLNLYPNPTFDYVYFSGDINEGTDYELTDAQGRIILVGKLLSDKNINLFDMSTGLYWIKFKGYQPLQVVKQ